jgi:hypothetical protein
MGKEKGMSYIVPKEIPNCCGLCPCFHAEHPMYCQAVKADKNKRIYAPYVGYRPDWCPLIEVPTPHGRLIDADFEEQHYTSMTTNPTPDVTEQDKRNSLIIIEALQMAKTVIEAED